MKSKVAVVKVKDNDIYSTIENALKLIDFDYSKLKDIIIKPNLVSASDPNEGKTTSPELIDAVVRLFKIKKTGIGESIPYTAYGKEYLLKKTGINEVCNKNRIEFNQFEKMEQEIITIPNNIGKISVPKLLSKNSVINVPKLKIHLHSKIKMSCCIKNMFGCVSGIQKSLIHTKTKEKKEFFETLLLIYDKLKPILNIVDAINVYDIEPGKGNKINLGYIVVGEDGVAVDTVISKLISINEDKIALLKIAKELKIGISNINDIEILGEDIDKIKTKFNFANRTRRKYFSIMANLRNRYISKFIKPRIKGEIEDKCIDECPTKSIERKSINYKTCIKCEHCLYTSNNIYFENNVLTKIRNILHKKSNL